MRITQSTDYICYALPKNSPGSPRAAPTQVMKQAQKDNFSAGEAEPGGGSGPRQREGQGEGRGARLVRERARTNLRVAKLQVIK